MEGGFTRVVADHFSSGKIDGQIWLDMDRGALPVQEITFCKEEPSALGPLMVEPNLPAPGVESEYWITEVREFKDSKGLSVWLPTKMKQSDTYGTSTQEVDIAKTKLNPEIDPHLFRVKFPIGASVFNPATGSFFTTDPNNPSLDDTLPLPRRSILPINVTK